MNPIAIIGIVNSVVDLVQVFLPMIGGNNSAAIGKVIDTVQSMAPLVTSQIADTYTGIKNIIATIGDHPATTEEQLAALAAFSKTVDDAWDAIEAKLDPDAQPPAA